MQAHHVRRVDLQVHEPVVDSHPLVPDDAPPTINDTFAAGVVVRLVVGEARVLHRRQRGVFAAVEHVREQLTVDVLAHQGEHVVVGGFLPAYGVDGGGDVLARPPREQ